MRSLASGVFGCCGSRSVLALGFNEKGLELSFFGGRFT